MRQERFAPFRQTLRRRNACPGRATPGESTALVEPELQPGVNAQRGKFYLPLGLFHNAGWSGRANRSSQNFPGSRPRPASSGHPASRRRSIRQGSAQANRARTVVAMVPRPERPRLESIVRIDPAALPEVIRSITLHLMGGDGDAHRRMMISSNQIWLEQMSRQEM